MTCSKSVSPLWVQRQTSGPLVPTPETLPTPQMGAYYRQLEQESRKDPIVLCIFQGAFH